MPFAYEANKDVFCNRIHQGCPSSVMILDFRRMPVVIGSSSSEWRPRRPPQIDSCIILPIQKAIKRAMPRNKQYKYPSRFLEMGKIRIQQDASGIP